MKIISETDKEAPAPAAIRKAEGGMITRILLSAFYLGVILLCVASHNPDSVISFPVTFGFGVFLSALFFILLLLFITYMLKRKKQVDTQDSLSFIVTPVTMFFALFVGYFSIQYLIIGGYDQRVFGYFSIFFPLLSYLTFLLIPSRTLKRFLTILVLSVSIVLIGQSLIAITYINSSADSVVAENKTDVDLFIAELCKKTSNNTPACENTEQGSAKHARTAVHNVKDYSFKDMYKIPLGGSNYIADLLLICLAATLFIPGLHLGVKLLFYVLVGTTIFLFESFGGILAFLFLSILLVIFKPQVFDSAIVRLTGHSVLQVISRRKKIILRILVAVISSFTVALVILFSYAVATKKGNDSGVLEVLSTGRLGIYRNTLHYVAHRPVVGFGFQFDAFMDKPHNLLLALLAYGGIVGFVVTISLFASLVVYAFRLRNSYGKMFIAMTLVTFFHGMIEPTLFSACADLMFWTFGSIALSVGAKQNKKAQFITVSGRSLFSTLYVPRAIGALVILSAVIPLTVSSSNQYLGMAYVDITDFDSEKAGMSLPANRTTSEAIVRLLETSTGARTLEDSQYLEYLGAKHKINLDPHYPNDSLYFYWDRDRKSLAIRFLVEGGSERNAEAQIKELGKEYAKAASERYPYLAFTYTGSEVVGSNVRKVLFLKIALGISALLSWYLLFSSTSFGELEIRRAHGRDRKRARVTS